MKFIVERTSSFNKKPCKEAKKEEILCCDIRVDSLEKTKEKYPCGDWEEYYNWKGGCRKDYKEKRWTIEINSLEDLMKFKYKYGDICILSDTYGNSDLQVIEIYDDWRE